MLTTQTSAVALDLLENEIGATQNSRVVRDLVAIRCKADIKSGNQTKLIRAQSLTFSDWCTEVRELAGERWPEVADQCATLYAVWGGGATPAQALHMLSLILPPKAAA